MPGGSSGWIKVFLLDDHDLVRQGLRDLLAPAREIHVVGEGSSARSAAASILRLGADVMVLDLHLQDGSGVHVCRQVRAVDPSVRGLLVTSADDDEAQSAAVLAGASGVVVKLARTGDVLTAIRRLGAGGTLIDRQVATRVSTSLRMRAQLLTPAFTPGQMDALDEVLAGRTDSEIAEVTGRAPEDVRLGVASIVDRLLASTPDAVKLRPSLGGGGKHRRTL